MQRKVVMEAMPTQCCRIPIAGKACLHSNVRCAWGCGNAEGGALFVCLLPTFGATVVSTGTNSSLEIRCTLNPESMNHELRTERHRFS